MPEVPADPEGDGGLIRVRLDIGYDGTNFSGWAKQRDRRTVQGEVERAVGRILQLEPAPSVTCAGRTYARVHARGQVAHVDLPEITTRLAHQLCGVLPDDVTVTAATPAPAGFDARFSALSRQYSYRVRDGGQPVHPLRRWDVVTHKQDLDLGMMNQAAEVLIGEHDFAAFCRRRPGATAIRQLLELAWARDADGLAVLTIKADAFCHSMVRSLVGSMFALGDGRQSLDWLAHQLASRVRSPQIRVAPPHGLVLEAVEYPPDSQLLARSLATRARRA